MKSYFFSGVHYFVSVAHTQVGIGTNNNPHAKAALEIKSKLAD